MVTFWIDDYRPRITPLACSLRQKVALSGVFRGKSAMLDFPEPLTRRFANSDPPLKD